MFSSMRILKQITSYHRKNASVSSQTTTTQFKFVVFPAVCVQRLRDFVANEVQNNRTQTNKLPSLLF